MFDSYKKNCDERIVETRRKINSRAFSLMFFGLMVILLYRQFFLGQSIREYADLFILWMLSAVYVAFGGVLRGINPFPGNRHLFIIFPCVTAATIIVVQWYYGRISTVAEGVVSLTAGLICGYAVYLIMHLLYVRWERKNLGKE